jgi:hypothetical protein
MESKAWISHMEWAVMLLTILGLFYSMDAKFESVNHRIDSANVRFDQFMFEWKQESKEFHGRLCAIEERGRNDR